VDLKSQLPPKDWPHAPVHRLADNAVYFVTARPRCTRSTSSIRPEKRDLLESLLLSFAKESGLATGSVGGVRQPLSHRRPRQSRFPEFFGEFLHDLHGVSARELNKLDGAQGRNVWFNFRGHES